LAALKQAQALNPGDPANLAFLAMTHSRIGQTGQARMALAHLRDAVHRSLPERLPEAPALLREAEELIQGRAKSPGQGAGGRQGRVLARQTQRSDPANPARRPASPGSNPAMTLPPPDLQLLRWYGEQPVARLGR